MQIKWLKITSLLLAFLAVSLQGYTAQMEAQDLTVNLKLNQTNFKVNDEFILEIEIVNNGNQTVRILPRPHQGPPREYNWFEITDSKGKGMEGNDKGFFQLDVRFPYKDSYVVLSPGASHVQKIHGKIIEGEFAVSKDNSVFHGIVVEFDSTNVLLSGPEEYNIQAFFKHDEFRKNEAMEKFGFDDMWQGEISSNKVNFNISN